MISTAPVALMDTTWAHRWITTGATKYTSQKRGARVVDTVIFSFQNINATNLFQGPCRYFCFVAVPCASEHIYCNFFQLYCNCPAPSTPPTFGHFQGSPSININPTFASCVSSRITAHEQNPSYPCAQIRLPMPYNSLTRTHLPCNFTPVTAPRTVYISEGEPQSGTISEGGSYSDSHACSISEGAECPLCSPRHGGCKYL
jgi:hypothetical protein